MKSSEELMVLLELNGFDITKYKLKKQLEYEKTGNIELYKHKKYADLLVCHYNFEEDTDYLHRNPLTYRTEWDKSIESIDQFYVKHPDLDSEMTLKDFLAIKEFNDINRESILYDILDSWVEEYREASITQMENLRDMVKLLPKKSKKYRKPRKGTFFFSILLAAIPIFLFKSPDTLKPSFLGFLNFWGDLVDGYAQLLYDVNWYSFFGQIAIYGLVIYAVLNNAFTRYIRDIRSEKNKHAEKTFDKWEQNMKDARLKQSGILEDYVDRVVKKPKKSKLEIISIIGPELLMDKFKDYVQMIERKYDFMTKYYGTFMKVIRIVFVVSVLLLLAFLGVGFALTRGWI
jgi:hypothetical protein